MEWLTVSQTADAVGMSKQAIYAKIKSNWHGIESYLSRDQGSTMIRSDALTDVFGVSDKQQRTNNNAMAEKPNSELMDALRQTIVDKNKEIERLQALVDSLTHQNADLTETIKLQTQANAYKLTQRDQEPRKGFLARLFHRVGDTNDNII